LSAFADAKGAMSMTGSEVMNPFAGSGQNNLYRCFIDLGFRLASPSGCIALIHQDGHLTEPSAGAFRKEWYGRVIKRFHFRNQLTNKNFSEIGHRVEFSANIYRGTPSEIRFDNISQMFLASQVDDCYRHDGVGDLPVLKDESGAWDTRGHFKRIVRIDREALSSIHALTESDDTIPVEQTRFLSPFSGEVLAVFSKISRAGRFEDITDSFQLSPMWHESSAQKELKSIKRDVRFPATDREVIFSAPHIYVGNPFFQVTGRHARSHGDFENVDLYQIREQYLPRTIFARAIDIARYDAMLPRSTLDRGSLHSDFFRLAVRRRISLHGERTLIGAIIPRKWSHVHAILSLSFKNNLDLLQASALISSTCFDFLTKASGRGDMIAATIRALPWVRLKDTALHRVLRLASLTSAYSDLWSEVSDELAILPWHSSDRRLTVDGPAEGPSLWNRTAGLRSDFARRMALVEIDVLVAQAIGLTLDELIDIYRIYFPVLQQNERATWFDKNGRIVWTVSRGLPGVGYLEDGRRPSRIRWEEILHSHKPHLECEAMVDFMPGGPHTVTRTFEGPFDTCDRVEDYKRAWTYFENHRESKVAA
jgi:hypothetical protein